MIDEQVRPYYTKSIEDIAHEAMLRRQAQEQLNERVAAAEVAQSHIQNIKQKLAVKKVTDNRFQQTLNSINDLAQLAKYAAEHARITNQKNKVGV